MKKPTVLHEYYGVERNSIQYRLLMQIQKIEP